MKKLLVAAMGMAVAYGAFADPYINAVRFTGSGDKTAAELNELAQTWDGIASGKYIAAPDDSAGTNQYSIGSLTGTLPTARPLMGLGEEFQADPETELSVKTQFGKPLEFYVDPANNGAAKAIDGGLYFDSLVKFTVCDDDPAQEYSDAKIVMWLQEATNSVGDVVATNIMVKAGYLSKSGSVAAAPKVYVCDNTIPGDFDQNWHRVTIKAIADITAAGVGVPGFAIYIDGGNAVAIKEVAITDPKWDSSFDYALSEAAAYLNARGMLFPSLKQGGVENQQALVSVGFDGTGWLNDLEITDVAPDFAVDHEASKATVVIGSATNTFESIEEAIDAINDSDYFGQTASLSLMKSLVLSEPIVFTGAGATTITLDFAGFVLTNELADAAITNNAATLIITNSSETVGGIYCDNTSDAAFYAASGVAEITAGFFHGLVGAAPSSSLDIVQGYFTQDAGQLSAYLPEGKTLGTAEEMPGFNKVIDQPVITWTITFDPNEGVLTGDATQVIDDGDSVVKPSDPTREGYTFTAWYWDDDGEPSTQMVEFYFSDAQDPVLPESDITLYAQWEPVGPTTFTVTVAAAPTHTTVAVVTNEVAVDYAASYTVNAGDSVSVTYTADTGYELTVDTSTSIASIAENVTVAAPTVAATSYTITYNLDLDGATNAVGYIESYTIETPTFTLLDAGCEGYTFNGWTNALGEAVTTITLGSTGAITVYASWTQSGGGSDWDDNPSAGEGKTAAEEYPALAGSALAEVDAPTLTTWAKDNGVTMSTVAEATAGSTTYDAYLLNCAPNAAAVEEAKEAFAIPAITVSGSTISITAPAGTYNGKLQMKGSNDLSTWSTIDSTTGYQFFKYELVP